jgi:hypothetical protein
MKFRNIPVSINVDVVHVTTSRVCAELPRAIKEALNLPDEAYINKSNEWSMHRFSSHIIEEVIRPATRDEQELMSALQLVTKYVQTNIPD